MAENLGKAKTEAEKSGTESTTKSRSFLKKVIIGIGAVVVLAMLLIPITMWVSGTDNKTAVSARAPEVAFPAEKIPLETDKVWAQILLAPGGRSASIKVPEDMHVVAKGDDFLTHTVYANGAECTFGTVCQAGRGDGKIDHVYFTDAGATSSHFVSYAFGPK